MKIFNPPKSKVSTSMMETNFDKSSSKGKDLNKHQGFDWVIFLCVTGLMLFSIAFVYSASGTIAELRYGSPDKLFWNHSIRVIIALIVMIIFAKIDYKIWKKFAKPILYISILFLILVFFIGSPINGAYRWIYIGPVNFQPSELAKFALVLILAVYLSERQDFIKSFRLSFFPMLIWIGIICVLIALQPNFSTALVIFLISMTLLFIGNVSIKHLIITLLISLSSAIIYALNASYRFQRIVAFIENVDGAKEAAVSPAAFQLQQALIAFGNGGIFGRGPGQSRQSLLYLPESYGDFIFSIIGEEYGFFGVVLLLLVFAVIVYRGIKIAQRTNDSFAYFLLSGIIITISLYVFVSAGVNIGLLPTTGLPLPFISYGGTAVIFYAASIGIVLNISKNTE
ncbi:MAG: putative lipid II flippase FtsW [Candidatus Kapabacteria bacterium]|nr:putative lipid II flippase FtsW [Candidatus Kapabacteria bacterium]